MATSVAATTISVDLTIPSTKKKTSAAVPSPGSSPTKSGEAKQEGTPTLEEQEREKAKLEQEAEEEEEEPQWALDSLGFFMTKGAEKYDHNFNPKSHCVPQRLLKRFSHDCIFPSSSSSSSSSSPTSAAASSTTTAKSPTTPSEKCELLSESLSKRIEWWKLRARELDSTTKQQNQKEGELQKQQEGEKEGGGGTDSLASWKRILLHEIRLHVRVHGVNPAERSVAWPLLGGLEFHNRTERLEKCMQALSKRKIDTDLKDVMLRDLGRTLPTHSLFRGRESVGQQALERVLHCYCALDPDTGYTQGMGFIVALLLLHMPEPDAFGLFVQMMHGKRYQMRGLFQSGFPLLQRMLELFRSLLRLVLPTLMEHFDSIGIDPGFFASHWFMTLFSYQFSVPLVCRIWDLFLSEGWIWIYRVALALLEHEQKSLLEMPMEEILVRLKTIHEGKTEEEILRAAKNMCIRESDLVDLENSSSENVLVNEGSVNAETAAIEVDQHRKRFP